MLLLEPGSWLAVRLHQVVQCATVAVAPLAAYHQRQENNYKQMQGAACTFASSANPVLSDTDTSARPFVVSACRNERVSSQCISSTA